MQSLLLDRAIKNISPLEFATVIAETFYSNLQQNALTGVFPLNCHTNAAVNSMSLETNDYKYLLSASADSSITLWDVKSEIPTDDANNTAAMDYNYKEFDIYDYDNPKCTFMPVVKIPKKFAHNFGISAIQWWPFDTGMFVSASFDHTVKIWDTNEMTTVHEFDMETRVYSIDICGNEINSLSSTALVAVAGDQPFIRLLDLKSTASAHTLAGHKGKTLNVKWHPQNPNILASGGYDGEVKVWDIRRSKSCLCRLDMLRTNDLKISDNLTRASVKAHLAPVNGLVWDQLGYTLFTAGNDDKIRVWDMISSLAPPINKLINFGPLTRNKYPLAIPLLLSPKAETELQYILFPSDNGDVYIFRTIDGKMLSRLTRKGSKNTGRTTSMVSASPFLATYYCGTIDGEINVWSPMVKQPVLEDLIQSI